MAIPISPIKRGKLGLPGNDINIAPIAIIAPATKTTIHFGSVSNNYPF